MRAAKILISWLAISLIIGCLIWYLPSKLHPQYTARIFIRVLPGFEKGSVVALIKHQSTLEALVDKDEVQKTQWFLHFGKTKDARMAGAVADLKYRFAAAALPDSDLVLNEMVDLFLLTQQAAKRKQIISDLSFLEDQQVRVQRDLTLAEGALDEVRRRYGLSDLEEHCYPDTVIARLIDLQKQIDNCVLEKNEVRFLIDDFNAQNPPVPAEKGEVKPATGVGQLQARFKLLEKRFTQLQALKEDSLQQKEELDLARTQYAQRKAIRDERRQALDRIKSRMDEVKMFHDDPDSFGVQFVAHSVDPRQADTLLWQTVIPPAAIVGVFLGIAHLFLTKRAGKTSS